MSIFDNQFQAVQELPQERRGAMWEAMMNYIFLGEIPTLEEPMERLMWQLIQPYLDKAKTNSENGRKAKGKAKGKANQESETKAKAKRNESQTKAKRKPNESENKAKTKRNESEPLSENENERERFEKSLKDFQTLSNAYGAGGDNPAPPALSRAARETLEQREHVEELQANSVPCPADLKAALCS